MDQIQTPSSPYPSLPPQSQPSSSSRQHIQLQIQQHQQRLLAQQQQQQLYNNLPPLHNTAPYSPSNTLPPIPSSSQQHYFTEGPTHTTPPTSSSIPSANWQRTSNSREELHPRQQYLSQQLPPPLQPQPPQLPQIKRESMNYSTKEDRVPSGSGNGHVPQTREDPMPSTSDFVKKLYKYGFLYHLALFRLLTGV